MTQKYGLSAPQKEAIEAFVMNEGRIIDQAKWQYSFNNGTKEAVLEALLAYQNTDGGFGNGLEADIRMPESSSIASTEAVLIAYEYELDCNAKWFNILLNYFEQTISSASLLPSYWEKVPPIVENHPHAPWWHYNKSEIFSPNPCAVIASAFIQYGSPAQKIIGQEIAKRCIDFLLSSDECSEHDCYCLQTLIEVLAKIDHKLVDSNVFSALERRIGEVLCTDQAEWGNYVAQPLDLAHSKQSSGYKRVKPYIEENIGYWLKTLKPEGYWEPNFSWQDGTVLAEEVSQIWRAYIAVKRVRILSAFEEL